eukprot:c8059_g1_i1 orf=209-763(+)
MPQPQHYSAHQLAQGCARKTELAAHRRAHCLACFDPRLDPVAICDDSLIRFFASYGTLLEANLVFCTIPKPSVYTWHAIISAHAAHGQSDGVLELYYKMQQDGVGLNKYVFPCVIKACSTLGALQHGKCMHDNIVRNAVECDSVIGCALLDMYARCGSLEEARNVFDNLPYRDVVSWGAMIAGY